MGISMCHNAPIGACNAWHGLLPSQAKKEEYALRVKVLSVIVAGILFALRIRITSRMSQVSGHTVYDPPASLLNDVISTLITSRRSASRFSLCRTRRMGGALEQYSRLPRRWLRRD